MTGSLNTTRKRIGLPLLGSAWPEAWLIVTAGRRVSIVQVNEAGVGSVFASPPTARTSKVWLPSKRPE